MKLPATAIFLLLLAKNYYELQGNNNFSELFDFDQWQESDKPDGEPVLILRFAEQFILEIYSNGYAAAHNSYAPGDEKSDAFYSIPQNTADNLIAYVEQFGNLINLETAQSALLLSTIDTKNAVCKSIPHFYFTDYS